MDYYNSIKQFLKGKGWKESICSKCGSDYFYKKNKNNCGSYKCATGYNFLNQPSPNKYFKLENIEKIIRKELCQSNFSEEEPISVKRDDERTLFASAAGQIYDDFIYEKEYSEENLKKYVFQPVIRLQGYEKIPHLEGISSSFINAGSEIWNSSIKDHLESLDKWFDIFSQMGLFVSNFNLKYKKDLNYWAEKKVPSESLKINYKGLEIGIANFFHNIYLDNKETTFSDISIGLERLTWAVNRTDPYFDAIGPMPHVLNFEREKMDAIRTLTLMSASGVKPDIKNHGQKFRLLAQNLSEPLDIFPIQKLVYYYHSEWSKYLNFPFNKKRSLNIIENEINRLKEINLKDKYDINNEFEKEFKDIFNNPKLLEKIRSQK